MCLCSISTRMLCKTYQKVQEAQPSKNVANSLSTILRFVLLFEMTTCTVSPPLRMALPLSWKHGGIPNSSLSTNRKKTLTIGSRFSIWLLFMNDNLIIANSSFACQSSRKAIRSRQLRCKHTYSPTLILDVNYLAVFVLGFSFPIAKAFCHWQFFKSTAFITKATRSGPGTLTGCESHRYCLTIAVLTIGIRGMTQLRSVSTMTLPIDHGHLQGFLQTPKQKCNHAPGSATALQYAQLTITAVLVTSPVCAALPCA